MEDQGAPGRGVHWQLRVVSSAPGELRVGVGVGDSRLPPLAPNLHEHACIPHHAGGPQGMSVPGVTNKASTHQIPEAGLDSGTSGSACQPNHHGDFALAPRSPTDLDYMEQNSLLSTHGHAPVVYMTAS